MFKQIVICSDGSDQALQGTRVAADLAGRFHSQITLLSVFNPDAVMSPFADAAGAAPELESVLQFGEETHASIQEKTGKILEEAGLIFQSRCECGPPVETIVRAAQSLTADLLVMGSRGLSEWKALLLGSVSDGVLHQAPCPVLIVRGDAAAFERILLASDGSGGAFVATMTAGMLARNFGVPLTILNVVDPPGALDRFLKDEASAESRSLLLRSVVAQRIRRVAEQDGSRYTLCQEAGHPAETIVRYAKENKVSLIVLGNRGMSGIQALALGSVSDRVAHHAHCSVLVVR